MVTHSVGHFAAIVRRWAEAGQGHAGCILVTLPRTAYGSILRGIEQAFAARRKQEQWVGWSELIGREQ